MSRLFPVFIDLAGRPCLVIGGGTIGTRKAKSLLAAGARVTVVSPHLSEELLRSRKCGEIRWLARPYRRGDLAGTTLAFGAVDDPTIAEELHREAEERGILLNCADSVPFSNFHVPAVVERGDLKIAISTGGKSPAVAAELKERLSSGIEEGHLRFLAAFTRVRRKLLARYPGQPEMRKRILKAFARSMPPFPWTRSATPAGPRRPARKGTAYLVGAGPGDRGLLTLRGLELLETADEVYHDRLVGKDVLALVPPGTRLVSVGKEPGKEDRIDSGALIARRARAGKSVVRLKGGDPNTFGRGGEEMLALIEARVPFEVVPGVSALSAVPSAAGIPITHRGTSREVIVRSGHRDPASPATGPTYVYFMTMARLPEIVEELLSEGIDPSTPSAVIQEGTLPGQRVALSPLFDMADRARREGLHPPALVVVGDVVRFARGWKGLHRKSLSGRLEALTFTSRPGHELFHSEAAAQTGKESADVSADGIIRYEEENPWP